MSPNVLAVSYLLAAILGQFPKPANDNGLTPVRATSFAGSAAASLAQRGSA
jgi:hypothetical protein